MRGESIPSCWMLANILVIFCDENQGTSGFCCWISGSIGNFDAFFPLVNLFGHSHRSQGASTERYVDGFGVLHGRLGGTSFFPLRHEAALVKDGWKVILTHVWIETSWQTQIEIQKKRGTPFWTCYFCSRFVWIFSFPVFQQKQRQPLNSAFGALPQVNQQLKVPYGAPTKSKGF